MRRALFLLLGLVPIVISKYQAAPASGPEGYLAPKPVSKPATTKNLKGPSIPNEIVIPTAREINPLTEKLIEISMSNKVGNVLPNCVPHGRMDMLTCNLVSMLTMEQVVNGTNALRALSMLDFVAVEAGTRRAKGGKKVMFVQWGYCPKMKGHKKDPWAPWISLVRIFGGKSCVRVYLTEPSKEVKNEANAVQKAVEAMVADTAEAVSEDGKYAKEERKQDKAIKRIEKQIANAEQGKPMLPAPPGGDGPPRPPTEGGDKPPAGDGDKPPAGGGDKPPGAPGGEPGSGLHSDGDEGEQTRDRPPRKGPPGQ